MGRTAVMAFSGDPITNGHLDVISRALFLFDDLVVAIGSNPDKRYTFSLEEREKLARYVIDKRYDVRVAVKSFQGLLTDFCCENQIHTICSCAGGSSA